MKGWFGPRIGTNTGYDGVWRSYDVAPVSWEGWVIFLIYIAVQIAVAWLAAEVLQQYWLLVAVPLLHLVFLWIASRRFVTMAERDPSTLPSDLR